MYLNLHLECHTSALVPCFDDVVVGVVAGPGVGFDADARAGAIAGFALQLGPFRLNTEKLLAEHGRLKHDEMSRLHKLPIPTLTIQSKAKPEKNQPAPILAINGGVITEAMAAAGFLSMFSRAIAPAAA